MNEKTVYLLGVGHNTFVMLDFAIACGYAVNGLYHYNDDRTGEWDHGCPILGSFNDLWQKGSLSGMSFLLTMGDLKIRKELAKKYWRWGVICRH